MDELGKLRSVSDSALSEEEIVQRVIESQPSTHISISGDTPFDVVQEKVRLLEQLGAANVQLSPGTIALLDEQLYFTPDLKGLQSPGIAPEDLRDLQQQARLLLKDSGAFLFRIFSAAIADLESFDRVKEILGREALAATPANDRTMFEHSFEESMFLCECIDSWDYPGGANCSHDKLCMPWPGCGIGGWSTCTGVCEWED